MDTRIGENTMIEQSYDIGNYIIPKIYGKNVGEESRKTWNHKAENKFFNKYMYGDKGLDIGGTGYLENVKPILPSAKIIGLDYPGYDGRTLPFADNSQDYVYSSHCLEHITDYKKAIQEWYRVVKVGGYIITVVPHRDLYEKKKSLPSRFNEDHKRFYKTSDLVREFEESLPINSFRIRHLQENDQGATYTDPPEKHGTGQYEIEMVIEKL